MLNLLNKFKNDESGATAIEYGLIAALISVALIGGAQLIGGEVRQTFTDIGQDMQDARNPAPTNP